MIDVDPDLTRLQVADMLPSTYTSICEDYKAAHVRLLAELHDDHDPAFIHRAVRATTLPATLSTQSSPLHPDHDPKPHPHLI